MKDPPPQPQPAPAVDEGWEEVSPDPVPVRRARRTAESAPAQARPESRRGDLANRGREEPRIPVRRVRKRRGQRRTPERFWILAIGSGIGFLALLGLVLAVVLPWRAGAGGSSLPEARRGFQTRLVRQGAARQPVPVPPADLFRVVHFDAPVGQLAAYLSPAPPDGKKHPAIIWITGGDCNTIDDGICQDAPADNDQTAGAFRKAGIPMMFPSLRGGNDNPGLKEGFLGEVDDVLAAATYLGRQDFVDPQRIYLGGHSTGGTLVFLVAASSDRFRAVFSFGPVDNVRGYPPEYLPFNTFDRREIELRSPIYWLDSVRSPLFVLEGADQPGNVPCLQALSRASRNPLVHLYPVKRANHFSILAPATRLLAGKILQDDGASPLTLTEQELNRLFGK